MDSSDTGSQFIATQSAVTGSAIVNLRATIQDISASDYANGDVNFGDIRNATVRFMNDGVPIVVEGLTDADGWITDEISLVDSTDIQTGIISLDWPVDIDVATEFQYNIGIEVEGYYVRNSMDDNVSILVYKPQNEYLTGGGYIIPDNSEGMYRSDDGEIVNFRFYAKYKETYLGCNTWYKKWSKVLKGNANIVFIRTQEDIKKRYMIRSTSIKSIGVNTEDPDAQIAEFVAIATLADITDYRMPTVIADYLTLQVSIVDKGKHGRDDEIAISLYSGNNLWYSSNWSGVETEALLLDRGNIQIHGGYCFPHQKSSEDNDRLDNSITSIDLRVWPNPSNDHFSLLISYENQTDPVILSVYNSYGKLLYSTEEPANTTITFGEDLQQGLYIVEIRQGSKNSIIHIVKE